MKANTCLCLGLTALAVWLARTPALRSRHKILVCCLAGALFTIAALTLCEYAFHLNFGIDQLLFPDPEHLNTGYPPGRFAPATGGCFLLLSAALICLDSLPRLSHAFTLAAVLVSVVALTGYLYNLPTLYVAVRYTSIAVPTILGILLLCLALLVARPSRGITAVLMHGHRQGTPVRRLIFGALFLPLATGWTALQGQRLGWYGHEFTLAVFAVLLMFMMVSLIWITETDRQKLDVKRRHAEFARRESQEHFHTMADNIPNLAWMAHPNGEVFWFNRQWYQYTGTTEAQMRGSGWKTVHDPAVLPSVILHWTETLAAGEPAEMVYPLRGADGVFRPFLTRAQPVRDENGRIKLWFGTNTDISSERKTQEELLKANRVLEEYAFVSAHDLKEPLRMVNLSLDLLLAELGPGQPQAVLEHAEMASSSVQRMAQLIKDLLRFSRLISHPTPDEQELPAIDLNTCLHHALADLATAVFETGAVVNAQCLPLVHGEEAPLTQVFQNLLSNSLKYRSSGITPYIRISTQQAATECIVCVEDNGIGFEPQYADRIFGLFKRLHRDDYQGTGIGLAICQRIVQRFGGRMWAESEAGVGARFYFALKSASTEHSDSCDTPSLQASTATPAHS